jgi:uncharacterized protein (UPF0248 family)
MMAGYTPVLFEYREAVEEAVNEQRSGRIFYFDDNQRLESADGVVGSLAENPQSGWFVVLHSGLEIPLHRIITLFGRPGPAYDEYDAYSIRCGECRDEED